MALANMGLKRPKFVSFWEGEQNVKEKEKRKRKEEPCDAPKPGGLLTTCQPAEYS